MIRHDDILRSVRVAKPCPASWEAMEGDERVRHCALCKLNVFNLSDMTREEAEELIRGTQGRLCIRYYQRRDGTILTKDCPVGVRAVRRKLAYGLACAFTLFVAIASLAARRPADEGEGSGSTWWTRMEIRMRSTEPFKSILDLIAPATKTPVQGNVAYRVTMGAVAAPTPPPTTKGH